MAELVVLERDGGVATVTLNRPEKLNALTKPLWRDLGAAIRGLSSDESVRCVVLRGAGERSFSPGNDISEFRTERADKAMAIRYGQVMRDTLQALEQCPHPVVARIHGICVGGGLEIASLCDIRICGQSSRFGVPIKNLGLVMSYHELAPLVGLVGPGVAREILLEGRIFDAQEALAKRLVTRVVPDDQVAEEVRSTVQRIVEGAPLAARWHKAFIRRIQEPQPLSDAEHEVCFDCFDTGDFREGYDAFLAKRKPVFRGL